MILFIPEVKSYHYLAFLKMLIPFYLGRICDCYISVHRLNHIFLPGCDIDGYVGWSAASLHAKSAFLFLSSRLPAAYLIDSIQIINLFVSVL